MKALLAEHRPLLRIAMSKLVGGMAGIDDVVAIDPAGAGSGGLGGQPVDLIVFGMPDDLAAGWQWLATVRDIWPAPRLLLLCDAAPLDLPEGDVAAGLCGCLPKSSPLAAIEAAVQVAIRAAMQAAGARADRSQFPLFPALAAAPSMAPPTAPTPCFGVAACSGDIADPTAAEAAMLGLSPREYDVLLLLARGHPFKSIGRLLRMSVPTVKTHAHAVYKRLEVHGKEAAIYKARQQGARLVWGEGEAARAGVAPLSLARAEAPAMRQIELPI